jgi:hypothetical protein
MLNHIFIIDIHVLFLPAPIPRSPIDGLVVHPGSADITNNNVAECSIWAFDVFNAHNAVFAPVLPSLFGLTLNAEQRCLG